MSWYKHWLLWGVVGGGTGYLVGSQKYFKLKHEAIITTIVGGVTAAATAALINKFTTPKSLQLAPPPTAAPQVPQGIPQGVAPANSSDQPYQSSPPMASTRVEEADPIAPEIDDDLQGSSIADTSMLSWDEDEDEE